MKTAIVILVGLWLGLVIFKLYKIYVHGQWASNVPWLIWLLSAVAVLVVAVVFLFAL
jgi:hypothetical protein